MVPFELLAKVPASSDLQNAPGVMVFELMLGVTLAEGEGEIVGDEVREGEALCSVEIVGLGVGIDVDFSFIHLTKLQHLIPDCDQSNF